MRHHHILPGWNPHFASTSEMYAPLRHLAEHFAGFEQWPALHDYQQLLQSWPVSIKTLAGKTLQVVAQADTPNSFEEHYAPRICNTGEIQTRNENWHDFFQYLTWLMFPQTKAVINAAHLPHARQRLEITQTAGQRSPVENMLSLFDEGGAVIISSEPELLQLIRDFKWQELFWQRRAELQQNLNCITFGHAMYEKGLAPYLGMTANCILLVSDDVFFTLDNTHKLQWLDQKLAAIFQTGTVLTQPKDLQPFPILGMPGWDADNAQTDYYDNSEYFRPGRKGNHRAVLVEC